MATVKKGDTIRVQYTGKLEDGTVFDRSEDDSPLEFTVGTGDLIKGFEEGVIGMNVGESKTIKLSPENAYGLRMEDRVFEFDRAKAPEDFDPEVGRQVQMYRADGQLVTVTITGKSEKSFTMDCNHPLAGKNLIFDIKLAEIL